MNSIIKLILLFFAITLVFALMYGMTGQSFELLFSTEKCIEWFAGVKPYAWIIGIVLLVSDIALPVPATGVMAALGAVYGIWLGWFFSTVGSVLAGLSGYAAAKYLGKKGSQWIATEEEIIKYKGFFDQWGSYAIIISRIMPMMPEVITILAGLSRMSFLRFLSALIAGVVPVSLLFTWMGAYADLNSALWILFAVSIPVLLWPFFMKLVKI